MTPTPSPELPDLDRLEALARAATPGPWAYQEDFDAYTHIVRPVASPGWIIASATQTSKPEGEANGRWIAAANPAAVLALIELARRAQPEGMNIALREVTDKLAAASAENLSLDMENRQLREQLEARAQPEGESLEGRIVSVDVSTGEHDAGNRIFAELTGETGSDGTTLLAIEQSRNFGKPEGEAPQAELQAPSAAAMDDVVDNLREYADNAGYSHNDYQDTIRQAANTIEALRAQLWHWGPLAAQQAAAPGPRPHKIAELLRIYDEQGGDWCKIARAVESRYIDATSAPGTPEAPAWRKVTGPGQVGVGARLRFNIGDKQFSERAKLILNAGTEHEEVIYDKGRNFYFITSCVMSGFSNHKNVEFLPPKRAAQLDGGQGEGK